MKEILLSHPYDFKFHQAFVPEIEACEMLLEVAYCAICATDIRILEGNKKKYITYPCVIGHELSGTICKVGDAITNFHVGDRVGISPIIPCGHCRSCVSGKENLCYNRLTIGYQFEGGFAQYVRIPAVAIQGGNIVKISERLSFEEAALIEPVACCINGIKKAEIEINDNILIVGAGAIGQIHLQLCKLYGANFVAISDPVPHRREKAREFGANAIIDPTQEDISQLAAKCGIGEFNKIIFACPATMEVNNIINLCAKGGKVVLFSGFSGTGLSSLQLNTIHYNELAVVGSTGYHRQDYMAALSLLENGNINVKSLISDIYPIEEFDAAYAQHKSGNGFKVLIKP